MKTTIIIFAIKTILSIVLATVLSTIVLLSILGSEDSLFSLNVNDSYPDLIISEIPNLDQEDKSVGFAEVLSFIGVLPKDEFGDIEHSTVVKTRMNINSGSTKSNLDVYGIEQESLANIISALKNVQNVENLDNLEDRVEYRIIDSVNASPREVIVGVNLANSMNVEAGDELIISTTGKNFYYYSEVFNVKFVIESGNPTFDNAIMMSRDYIDSIAHPYDVSIMYFDIGNKDKSDQLKNILLENYSQNFEISSRNDYVNGYDLYQDIFDIIPIIYALLFSTMLLFFYSMSLKLRYISIKMIKDRLKSTPLVFIVSIMEVILSILFFIITLPVLELAVKSMYHDAYYSYRVSIVVISIIAIIIITAIYYLLAFLVYKKN